MCQHRWRIGTPDGPECAAYCKRCGVRRTYSTTAEHEPRYAGLFGAKLHAYAQERVAQRGEERELWPA